jgi:hypothetical protein
MPGDEHYLAGILATEDDRGEGGVVFVEDGAVDGQM